MLLLEIFAGVAAAFIGCVLPGMGMIALMLCSSWSLPAGISAYASGVIFSTWRELISPTTSADPELLSLGGKKLVFTNDRDQQIITIASVKLGLLALGILVGRFLVEMSADNIYQIAPFVLVPVVWVTLRKVPQAEAGKAIAFLGFFLIVIACLSWVPAILPILYMSLAANPKEEAEVKADASYEIKKMGGSSHSIAFWGIISGMMPGLNPGAIVGFTQALGLDPRIACIVINALGEGVSLGIFIFGRPTGKTVITEQLSKFLGEVLPGDVLIPCAFGAVVAIALIPVFVKSLDSVMPGDRKYRPLMIVATWVVSIMYASVNPFTYTFPYAGVITGVIIVAVVSFLCKLSIQMPDKIRPLLVAVPIVFL
jgi:hypothetical protein